ncbi:MAG: tetratricopeptide repeat protein, partial [Victivallaceae bacterium]
ALEKNKHDNIRQEQSLNNLKSENTALLETKRLFEQKNLEIGKLQDKYDKLAAENAKMLNEIKSLADLKPANDSLKSANDDLQIKVKDLAAVRENYKKLDESYQQAIEKIKSFSGKSSDEVNNKLVAMLSKSKTENQALSEKVTSMQRELSEKVTSLQHELSGIASLKKQVSEQKQLIEEYKDKYQNLTENSSKINMELAKLDELKNASSALSIRNKEMAALQDDYRKLKSNYQQALQSISAYQQSDKNKLNSLDELNKKLSGMLDKSKNEKMQLQQDIEALKQANIVIPALKDEINTLKSMRSGDSEAKKSLAAQLAKYEAVKEQLSSLDSTVLVLKKQLSDRDAAISDLKTRLSNRLPDPDISEKYAIAENKINILSENLKESRKKIQALETQLADRKAGITEIKLTAPAVSADKIQELLTNGIAAEKKQDIEVALWHFQMVLESEPANQVANRHLGKIYLQTEDYDKAVEHLLRAIKADSKNNDVAADYGFALIGVKNYEQAAETFKKINKAQPDSAKIKFGLGCALQGLGDLKKAEKEFRAALRIKPDSVEILQRLALLIAADKVKTGEAAELYRKSRKLGGGPDPELEKLLGGKLVSANNEAVSFLRQAAEDAEKSKDWGSAAWYYSQLIDLEPDNAAIPNKVGQLYLLQNSPDKALKTLKINDNDITALLVSAEAWVFKNNPDKALEMFSKAQSALGKDSQYSRPELLKALDSTVDLKIRNMQKAEKVYEIFKQFSKK